MVFDRRDYLLFTRFWKYFMNVLRGQRNQSQGQGFEDWNVSTSRSSSFLEPCPTIMRTPGSTQMVNGRSDEPTQRQILNCLITHKHCWTTLTLNYMVTIPEYRWCYLCPRWRRHSNHNLKIFLNMKGLTMMIQMGWFTFFRRSTPQPGSTPTESKWTTSADNLS